MMSWWEFLPLKRRKSAPHGLYFLYLHCSFPNTHTHPRACTHTVQCNHRHVEGCSQEWQMKEVRAPMETWGVQLSSAWIVTWHMSWVSPLQRSGSLSHCSSFSLSGKYIIWWNAPTHRTMDAFLVWLRLALLRGVTGSAFVIKWHHDAALGTMLGPPFILLICLHNLSSSSPCMGKGVGGVRGRKGMERRMMLLWVYLVP